MKTIFWHSTGPLLRYGDGTLYIEDLNPQITTQWKLGRWRAIVIAFRLIKAATFDKGHA